MLSVTLKGTRLLLAAVGIATAGLGCHGGSSRSGSPGCHSCQSRPTPAILQTTHEAPAVEWTAPRAKLEPRPDASSVPAVAQRTCPVTGAELGAMGPPVAVSVAGRTIQVCCHGCREKLLQRPQKYLARVDRELRGAQ